MSSADNARLGDMGEYQHTPRGCAECRKLRAEVERLQAIIANQVAILRDKGYPVTAAIFAKAALRQEGGGSDG